MNFDQKAGIYENISIMKVNVHIPDKVQYDSFVSMDSAASINALIC